MVFYSIRHHCIALGVDFGIGFGIGFGIDFGIANRLPFKHADTSVSTNLSSKNVTENFGRRSVCWQRDRDRRTNKLD